MIKKELRYIRHRICRTLYYADQCPMDNRRNASAMMENALGALALGIGCFVFMFLAVALA